MFKIGDFARLSRVPVKTLRYYDEIGLLKPIGVDRFTRYRYYSVEQLPLLNRILGLKEMGFSLEQVGQLIQGGLRVEQLRSMLVDRRRSLELQIEQDQQLLLRIDARLKLLDLEGNAPSYEVRLKKLEAQWVAAARGVAAGYADSEPVFDRLFDQVYQYAAQHGVGCLGPGMALYHDAQDSSDQILIEAACPLPGPLPPASQVSVYQLSAVECAACVVHHGPFASLDQAYAALITWIQSQDYRVSGPTRELYLQYQRGGEQSQFITEIQFPIEKRKESFKVEPKIIKLDAFQIVGLPYIGDNQNHEISQMWEVFNRRMNEIKHLAPFDAAYGVCFAHPTARMEYIAAMKVTEVADLPAGMVGKEVPAQEYVAFPCQGLENIGPTYHKIIQDWLPANGYRPGDGPDFEYYGVEFNPEDTGSLLYIYFPIQKLN
ncbi:MAG: GyrI-like domain-containing protein [Anaerolineales bacterium]|jgi:predicted transcriptional regulator YdeE/DNA-binding transcriptional MerR regulator|nr:GyrI-like domain-containing protein [Anaerolineales bacterium]